MGPSGPPELQVVSPSGDVRLTLRRYSPLDKIDSPHLLLRMDLRIQPRDLYSIPSDGHCGYHSLAVLSYPHYPSPPSIQEREELRSTLLQKLLHLPPHHLRAAATAGLQTPPPRYLPHQHWLHSDWLHQIPLLPPIGCLAQLSERDRHWYYCTAISHSPSQLEHSLDDLLRVADSGRLLLHSHAHYHPVSPPAFLSTAIRQCSALLQLQLGGANSLPALTRPPVATPPHPTDPTIHGNPGVSGGYSAGTRPLRTLCGGPMGSLHPKNHPERLPHLGIWRPTSDASMARLPGPKSNLRLVRLRQPRRSSKDGPVPSHNRRQPCLHRQLGGPHKRRSSPRG